MFSEPQSVRPRAPPAAGGLSSSRGLGERGSEAQSWPPRPASASELSAGRPGPDCQGGLGAGGGPAPCWRSGNGFVTGVPPRLVGAPQRRGGGCVPENSLLVRSPCLAIRSAPVWQPALWLFQRATCYARTAIGCRYGGIECLDFSVLAPMFDAILLHRRCCLCVPASAERSEFLGCRDTQ